MSTPPSNSGSELNEAGRRSSVHRIASSLRASAVSAVTAVEEKIEVGTIGGTVMNTTCNVIGAGVLSLPSATYNASLGWSIILTVAVAVIGAFSAYVLFIGCDRTEASSMSEAFAIAIMGKRKKQKTSDSDTGHSGTVNGNSSSRLKTHPAGTGTDPASPLVVTHRPEEDVHVATTPTTTFESLDATLAAMDRKRTILSLMIDMLIFFNNYTLLAVYSRIIIDSIPPVLQDFLHADGFWTSDATWCVGPAIIFFALTSVRNMAELKWSSILGIVTILYAVLCVFIEFCRHGYQGTDNVTNLPDKREIAYFEIGPNFASAIATLAVAYGYHYNAPIFYHELQNKSPRRMLKTVAISFPIIGVTYLTISIFGYLSFGQHVSDASANGEIINNYGKENTLINTCRLGLFLHFSCVYPVLSVCVRHSFHRFLLTVAGRRDEAMHPEMAARVPRAVIIGEAFALVSTSSVFSYFYSNVGQLIVFSGAICGATVMFTVPGIIGMCVWARRPDTEIARESSRALLERAGAAYGSTADAMEGLDGSQLTGRFDPPAHWESRRLMFGCSVGLVVLGLAVTLASFVSATTSA